jgi:hypothetical protein
VGLSDLAQTLASVAVLEDSDPVDVEWPPADMPAFQAGAAHPCSHPLDDEIPFKFCDGADDDHDGRPSGPPVSRFSRKLTNSMLR